MLTVLVILDITILVILLTRKQYESEMNILVQLIDPRMG